MMISAIKKSQSKKRCDGIIRNTGRFDSMAGPLPDLPTYDCASKCVVRILCQSWPGLPRMLQDYGSINCVSIFWPTQMYVVFLKSFGFFGASRGSEPIRAAFRSNLNHVPCGPTLVNLPPFIHYIAVRGSRLPCVLIWFAHISTTCFITKSTFRGTWYYLMVLNHSSCCSLFSGSPFSGRFYLQTSSFTCGPTADLEAVKFHACVPIQIRPRIGNKFVWMPWHAKPFLSVCVNLCSKEALSFFRPSRKTGGHSTSLGLCPTKLPVKWDIQPGRLDVPAFRDDTKIAQSPTIRSGCLGFAGFS